MDRTWQHHLVIVAFAGIVLFTNLGVPRLWDRDEPRNAGCAAEMMARGDWVVPVFNAELRVHKPVLLYWFMMSAYAVFGVNEFAARFWSAVLAIGTALATYHIGRRLFNARVGLWAALILSTALMFDVVARAATPDSVLIFFTTLAILVYVLATFRPKDEAADELAPTAWRHEGRQFPASWLAVALMYGLMGVAVLDKGPVGLVLPTAVVGMFLLIVRLPVREPQPDQSAWYRWTAGMLRPFHPLHFLKTCWAMRPITALAVVLAVALPWYVWVAVRTDGAWIEGFFMTHNVHRAMQAMEGHNGPIVYYLVALAAGFFPWSVFMVPVGIGVVRRVRQDDPWKLGLIFAACWLGVYLALFSLAQTKLPNYITPAYPAAALLTACYVYHLGRGTAKASAAWARAAVGILATAGLVMAIALPIAAHLFLPGEQWLGVVGLIPLAGGVACLVWLVKYRPQRAVIAFAVTAMLLSTSLFGLVAVRVDRHRAEGLLWQEIAARSAQPRIASYGCMEPSWVVYAGHPIKEFRVDEASEASAFLQDRSDAFILTTDERLAELRESLPPDVDVLAETPLFLKKDRRLFLLGRRGTGEAPDLEVASRPKSRLQ